MKKKVVKNISYNCLQKRDKMHKNANRRVLLAVTKQEQLKYGSTNTKMTQDKTIEKSKLTKR